MNEESSITGKTLRGHPPGLAILSATELAERFSYYGMTALLALYMVKQLLLPGHAEHVIGLAALRHLFEFRGPMSDQAFASLIYGWYGGLVYFTPLLGGWIADRFIGTKRGVTLGALLMAAGHLAMSRDETFLIALLLLIAGSGFLKGNISAQVGKLYPPTSESLRERGFTIFSTGINIGAVAGPLGTGTVAAIYGWHAGFALAAVLMLVALAVYLGGQRYLPNSKAEKSARSKLPPLTAAEKKRVWAILFLIATFIPALISYTMIWNVGIVWIDEKVSLGPIPASWFNSVDSFASIIIAPVLVGLWASQSRRNVEPEALTKLLIGFAMTGASALFFVAGSLMPGADGKVSVLWALAGYFGMGFAFMWYWPVALAIISKAAPAKVNSTLIGGSFLALFFGTVLMGWVGSFYEQMSNVAFWTLVAGIAFAGSLLIFAVKKPLTQALGLCSN
jgi:proton-dependent oligopeptide transporter, POT family